MAQNVTIAGASYSDVPAIDVPKTGGGTARFVDTSDGNLSAASMASGQIGYAAGSRVSGTAAQRSAESVTVTGNTVSVPAGIYQTAVTKTIPVYDGSVI